MLAEADRVGSFNLSRWHMPVDFTHVSELNQAYKRSMVQVANGETFVTLDMIEEEKLRASNVVYLHVHQETRRCYVGITAQTTSDRWFSGIGYKQNKRFSAALKKYGWSSFESHILTFAESRDTLNQCEVHAILAAGGHQSKFTYNLSPGGDTVADNSKAIIGINLSTGETRAFQSGTEAAKQLNIANTDMPMAVARKERSSVKGWWFRFEDDEFAKVPEIWGEQLRVRQVIEKQGKALIAHHLTTGEQRQFQTTAEAAKVLGVQQTQVSEIARGNGYSANGWWFKYSDDNREPPRLFGTDATRAARDIAVYATNLKNGAHHTFRNCTVADGELGIHKGAAASVASGQRVSAGDWWFSYDPSAKAPQEYKGALVAKARSKAIVSTNLLTGQKTTFPSAKDASEALSISRASISFVISGRFDSIKGYKFQFQNKSIDIENGN